MLKIRRSCDRLIFNMGIPIPGKDDLYIEMRPWWKTRTCSSYIVVTMVLDYLSMFELWEISDHGIDIVLLEYCIQISAPEGLTHCGLVTPYGYRDLGQHWLRQWLVAWGYQAITWTYVDFSWLKSSDIHIRAISQEMPQPSITNVHLKITYLKFYWNSPGANELNLSYKGLQNILCNLVHYHVCWCYLYYN